MVNLGELFFTITAKDESKGALEGAVGRIEKLTGLMAGIQVGQIVANAAVAVAGPVVDFFQSTVDASSNASEEISKFQQVFKDQAASGEDWIGKTAAEMGRSEGMIRSMAATFGAVLTPQMDGNTKAALELSEGYAELAVDLASFMNVSEDEAARAISSAIAGETEPMRKYGVMLNEAAINAELMAMGLNKTQKEASAAELQQARYNIIMKATADAQGDAVRTADGYANATRALASQFDALKIAVGDAIMPIVKSLVQVAGGAVKEFMKIWEGLAPKITPILDGIGKGILEFAKSIGTAALPAIQKIVDMLPGALSAIAGLFSKLGSTAGPMLAQIFAGLPAVIDGALSAFKGLASAIGPVIQRIAADIAPIAREIGETLIKGFKAVSDWWSSNGAAVFKAIGDGLMGIVKFVEPIGAAIMSVLVPALQSIGKFFNEQFQKVADWWKRDGAGIVQAVSGFASALSGTLAKGIEVVGGVFRTYLLPVLEWLAGGVLSIIMDALSSLSGWFNSSGVQNAIRDLAKGFDDWCRALEPVGAAITGAGKALAEWLGPKLSAAWDAIKGVAAWLGATLYPVLLWIWDTLSKFAQWLGSVFVGIWEALKNPIGAAWEWIKSTVGAAWEWICGLFTGASGGGLDLVAIVGGVWEAIKTAAGTAWELIKSAVVTAAGLIWSWFSTEGLRLAGVAVTAIWTAIKDAVPGAWNLIQTAVITAAGLIWTWLTGTGKDQGNSAVNVIWTAIKDAVPGAWNLIQTAVITAAGLIWSWMKTTAPGLAVAAIAAAWSAIAGAVPGAWEAIKTAVKKAAQAAWDAAQAIFRTALSFEIPDIVGAARRAYDAAQRALKGDDSAGPAVAPTAAPGIDIDNPVAVAPSGTGGRWVDGHYISPGANGYWDHGTWVPVHHSGGIYHAPGGASEGLARLLDGERVLSPSQTRDYDGGLLSAVQALAAKLDQLGGGSGGGDVIVHGDVKLSEDYSYDRFREDVGRWKSSRIAKGVLS